jgi:hypothetical protein
MVFHRPTGRGSYFGDSPDCPLRSSMPVVRVRSFPRRPSDAYMRRPEKRKPGAAGSHTWFLLLREQDSNLQPCGYGRFRDFRSGPDYLITLK